MFWTFGCLSAPSALADGHPPESSPTLDFLKEEELVSIATRYEQPISQSPSNVYVITDEDIRHSGATDLPTVLRRIPGLDVMTMSGADINVSARGNNQPFANKMLVMVDGRSVYLDAQGTVYWKALPVTLPEIKRVEVLKGPAAAIYGFNAFDGVVNIITKSPEEMKGTTLQFGGGEYGTISSAAVHAGTAGKLGYRLSIGQDQNQQWRDREALAFRSHKFNVETVYALPRDSTIRVSGGLTDVNRFDGQIGEVVASSLRPAFGYANVAYEHGQFLVRAWWSGYFEDGMIAPNPQLANLFRITDRRGSPSYPFTGHTYNLDLQHSIDLGAHHRVLYGANYRHNTLSSGAIDAYSRENRLGVYAQDDWRLTSSLTLTVGLRYDLHTEISGTISPRVALVYRPAENHTFRASFSVAYRPPTLFETHVDQRTTTSIPTGLLPPLPTAISNTVPVRGSFGLDPEQMVSYELGYQGWFWNHRLRARADLFFNHLEDLIGSRDASGGGPAMFNDPGHADIYGGEAGIDLLATRWLTGFANVAYQEFDQSFQGTLRRAGPRLKAGTGLRGDWDNGWNAETSVYYVGASTYPVSSLFSTFAALPATGVTAPDQRIGSYTLLNARVAYRFWQEKASAGYMRNAEAALAVFNALNDRHKEHPLADTIGTRVMGWLTMRF